MTKKTWSPAMQCLFSISFHYNRAKWHFVYFNGYFSTSIIFINEFCILKRQDPDLFFSWTAYVESGSDEKKKNMSTPPAFDDLEPESSMDPGSPKSPFCLVSILKMRIRIRLLRKIWIRSKNAILEKYIFTYEN